MVCRSTHVCDQIRSDLWGGHWEAALWTLKWILEHFVISVRIKLFLQSSQLELTYVLKPWHLKICLLWWIASKHLQQVVLNDFRDIKITAALHKTDYVVIIILIYSLAARFKSSWESPTPRMHKFTCMPSIHLVVDLGDLLNRFLTVFWDLLRVHPCQMTMGHLSRCTLIGFAVIIFPCSLKIYLRAGTGRCCRLRYGLAS